MHAAASSTWVGRTLRFVQLHVGLSCFGFGIALMLAANIGLDPWSAFHQGVVVVSGWTFGQVTQSTGVLLVVGAYLLFRERPGIGTLCNMALIGPWIDLFRAQPWYPQAHTLADGVPLFVVGMLACALASGLYIGARFGAGPRDAFVLGLARRGNRSIRSTRIVLELTVLAVGWLLGAPIGIGTVLFAVLMGPLMQTALRCFRYDHRQPTTSPTSSGPQP